MRKKDVVVVMVFTAVFAVRAMAIDENFTPVELVRDSAAVVKMRIGSVRGEGVDLRVEEVLKGAFQRREVRLRVGSYREAREGWRRGKTVVLFCGVSGRGGKRDKKRRDLLYWRERKWLEIERSSGGLYTVKKEVAYLGEVWAGGVDMLAECVKYIVRDARAEVPVGLMEGWEKREYVGKVRGEVREIQTIEMHGRRGVFVASEEGDVFLWREGGRFKVERLPFASERLAFGDFDGDGEIEMLGVARGEAVVVKGLWGRVRVVAKARFPQREVRGLTVVGGEDRVSVVVSGDKGKLFCMALDGGRFECKRVWGGRRGEEGRIGVVCGLLAADFDGDGYVDLVQVGEKGSLMYRGTKEGFTGPSLLRVAAGREGKAVICDFDGDGMFDIFCYGEGVPRLWRNGGERGFEERLESTGDLIVRVGVGITGVCVGDVNTDGREDLLLTYGRGMPQIFFNRGFMCFGYAHVLDLREEGEVLKKGQQGGVLIDVDGNGNQDMILVDREGGIWCWMRESGGGAVVRMRVGKASMGPIRVVGAIGTRCLGARNVVPGYGSAFFGVERMSVLLLRVVVGREKREKKVKVGAQNQYLVVWP